MVNTVPVSFFVCYVIINFPSVIALDADKPNERSGRAMMLCFKICAVLVIIGIWMRFILAYTLESFGPLLVPSFFLAMLYPFFLNGMSKFVCLWFGDGQRATAMSLVSLAMPFGTIIGFIFAPVYIKNQDKYNFEKCREHLIEYMRFTAIQITVMSLPIILFYKAYPDKYPSKSAEENDKNIKEKKTGELKSEIKELFKNRNYVVLLTIFVLQYSV